MRSAVGAGTRRRAARNWWIGLVLAALGAVWLNGARGIASTTNYIGLGPAAIVIAVGAGLTVVGLLLLLLALRGGPAADATDGPPSRSAFLLALAGVAVPLATMRWLGFPLTAMLAFTLVTHGFGSRRTALDLAVGLVLGSAAWFGFTRLGISLGAFLPVIG